MLLINDSRFYSIMLTCLQIPINFKLKYFFSARISGEILIIHEPHYCDAFESNSMGAKRSYMLSFELQTLTPPLFLDVDLEGLEPLENFATAKDRHALNSKKPKKTKIYNLNKMFQNFQEIWALKMPCVELILNDVSLVTFFKC
jgi:hypothetical protein